MGGEGYACTNRGIATKVMENRKLTKNI